MPISESENFTFDNVSSTTHGLKLVHINSGMCEETFIPSRSLLETQVRGRNDPFFQEISQQPQEFNLTFAIATGFQTYATGTLTFSGVPVMTETVTINGTEIYKFCTSTVGTGFIAIPLGTSVTADNAVETLANAINANSSLVNANYDTDLNTVNVVALTGGTAPNAYTTTESCSNASWSNSTLTGGTDSSSNLRNICRWLITDYYKPMTFETLPGKIFYSILTNASTLTHTSDQGYFTANFRCNSPYCYSPLVSTTEYDLSVNIVGGTTITVTNNGDMVSYPNINITMCSGSVCSIVNTSDSNETITFTGIANDELLTIDCENEDVTSSAEPTTYRYDSMTGSFIKFVTGTNSLVVSGNVLISFDYENIYYA